MFLQLKLLELNNTGAINKLLKDTNSLLLHSN